MKNASALGIARVALVATLLAAGASYAGAKEDKTLNISLGGEPGQDISISLSGAWVSSLMEEMTGGGMDCDGDLDRDTEAMFRHLERNGPGSRYTLTEEDQTIHARRRKDSVEMKIDKADGSDAKLVIPWGLAEGMLGNPDAFEPAPGTQIDITAVQLDPAGWRQDEGDVDIHRDAHLEVAGDLECAVTIDGVPRRRDVECAA